MSYLGMLGRGWSYGHRKDRSGPFDHRASSKDLTETTNSLEYVERCDTTEGLTLERCDTLQKVGEVGSLVYWTISCDLQSRQGDLPVGHAELAQSNPPYFPFLSLAEVCVGGYIGEKNKVLRNKEIPLVKI